MNVYIGQSEQYSSFRLLHAAYNAEYSLEIIETDIHRNINGKPYFKSPNMPFFSISHSNEYIACAFSDREIGLDLQRIKEIPPRVVSKYLDTKSTDVKDQILEWTKFESYGKRLGCGIPLPSGENYNNGQYLHSYDIPGYILTVCVESKIDQTINLIWL